jgi:hypothetical protein
MKQTSDNLAKVQGLLVIYEIRLNDVQALMILVIFSLCSDVQASMILVIFSLCSDVQALACLGTRP